MIWFRRHIRQGSRLALFALAFQLVLAFGHTHSQAHAHAISTSAAAIADAVNPADDADKSSPHPLTEPCAVCATVAMTASALIGASPILQLPAVVSLLYGTAEIGFASLDPACPAFQPRAPPVS